MKLIEKPFRVGEWEGTRPAYDEVEPELLEFEPGIRVLPARFYFEKSEYITLIKYYKPGEHEKYLEGGFHCRWKGGNYYFHHDSVIIHPQVISQRKKKVRWEKRAEKRETEKKKHIQRQKDKVDGIRRRGRPALDPVVKQQRDAEKAERRILSGGKRGRPKKGEFREPKPYVPKGGKRGRPALSEEEKSKRLAIAEAKPVGTGKRGRPSNPAKAAEREEKQRLALELNPTRRRGRPPRS